MEAVMDIGSSVRYNRTGTTGKIVRIEERSGYTFAELDTTGMLYRIDLLIPALLTEKTGHVEDRSEDLKNLEKERQLTGEMSNQEILNLDGACNGAG